MAIQHCIEHRSGPVVSARLIRERSNLGMQLSLLLPHRFPHHYHCLKHPSIQLHPIGQRSVHASAALELPIRETSEQARLP